MKQLALLLVALLLLLLLATPALAATGSYTPTTQPDSEFVFLYNMDTEKIIYEKNADLPAYPASLTKIMTCILALENVADPAREMTVYPSYVQDYLYEYQQTHGSISLAGMYANEEMPLSDLLYGLMLPSGNETAMIIADHIAGGQAEFVAMMNRRAQELGAASTTFVNPNGLYDPQQVTTARDMATLTLHALTLPGFKEIVSASSYSAGPTNKNDRLEWSSTIHMQNPASSYYYPYLSGVKTGTLPESGRCFVSTATKDGFTYLLVTMGGPFTDNNGEDYRSDYQDHENIYEWAFDNFRVKSLVEKNRPLTEIPLRLNQNQDHLQLVTAERFTALVGKDVEPSTSVHMEYDLPDSIDAPVTKGDSIGWVRLILYGEEVGRVELLAAETVDASRLLVLWEQVKEVLSSFWFKFGVILFVLLILLYIVLMILRNRRRRNQKRTLYKPRRRI